MKPEAEPGPKAEKPEPGRRKHQLPEMMPSGNLAMVLSQVRTICYERDLTDAIKDDAAARPLTTGDAA